ncbi:hypothetical protein EMIHUDRAFT_104796 [Emiliania huxleyi CCMP1516]|uniref:Uncharacterized protein n=2 Tax=Emiliania huxleyi TaxID=2903 RepID=A0A0D3IJE8_EMIH1|nr:hypothetical protein EMIHUDRAFT_104796 [Emiliania huxleyi CCMP1516]EOD11383.1 hypothetical protein EMIHUDRAFT_104796 [Emiliania huxleyi CCMP1516]|eukprot:XP_005763812.1 hypothetical protein EMIHUDRAFT_104796 [Emiliania huxleyi CCMP1516]
MSAATVIAEVKKIAKAEPAASGQSPATDKAKKEEPTTPAQKRQAAAVAARRPAAPARWKCQNRLTPQPLARAVLPLITRCFASAGAVPPGGVELESLVRLMVAGRAGRLEAESRVQNLLSPCCSRAEGASDFTLAALLEATRRVHAFVSAALLPALGDGVDVQTLTVARLNECALPAAEEGSFEARLLELLRARARGGLQTAAGGPGRGGGDGQEGPLSGLSLHREVVSELSLSQPEAAAAAQLAEAVSAALEARPARRAPQPRLLSPRRAARREAAAAAGVALAQIRAERAASGEALLWGEALRGGSPAFEVLSPSRLHEVARGLRRRAVERAAVRGEARSLRSRLVELRVSLADLEARIAAVSAAPPADGRPPPDDGKWLLRMLRHADNAAARRTPEAGQTLESAAQLASLARVETRGSQCPRWRANLGCISHGVRCRWHAHPHKRSMLDRLRRSAKGGPSQTLAAELEHVQVFAREDRCKYVVFEFDLGSSPRENCIIMNDHLDGRIDHCQTQGRLLDSKCQDASANETCAYLPAVCMVNLPHGDSDDKETYMQTWRDNEMPANFQLCENKCQNVLDSKRIDTGYVYYEKGGEAPFCKCWADSPVVNIGGGPGAELLPFYLYSLKRSSPFYTNCKKVIAAPNVNVGACDKAFADGFGLAPPSPDPDVSWCNGNETSLGAAQVMVVVSTQMIGDKALLLSPNACDDMTAEGCALTGSHPMISCWLVDGGQVLSGNSLGISARLQLGPTLSDAVDDVIIDKIIDAGEVIISLIVKNFRCADAAATAVKVAKRFSAPTANVACGGASTRRRRLTDDLSLTITIPTIAANHDAVLNSATTLFQDEEAATALLGASVYSGSATVTDTSNGGADKDPHLAFPHGGTADFRGRNGIYYSFLSSPGLAVNDATFKLHNSKLMVDGSFITEVHLSARTARPAGKSAWANASFWAAELSDFNTGWKVINGSCSGAYFEFGLNGRKTCGDLAIRMRYASATFTFREAWTVVVRGNHVFDRVTGPTHRLDLTFKEAAGAAARTLPHGIIGQTFSSSAPRHGKQDVYPEFGRVATSAMAEGAAAALPTGPRPPRLSAIEGTAAMYEVASPFATNFAFSRFGATELAVTAGGLASLAAGAEATSTERE